MFPGFLTLWLVQYGVALACDVVGFGGWIGVVMFVFGFCGYYWCCCGLWRGLLVSA